MYPFSVVSGLTGNNEYYITTSSFRVSPNLMYIFCFRPPTWWNRRTKMERCLTLTTAIIALIGISLLVALATVLLNKAKYNGSQTINSK